MNHYGAWGTCSPGRNEIIGYGETEASSELREPWLAFGLICPAEAIEVILGFRITFGFATKLQIDALDC